MMEMNMAGAETPCVNCAPSIQVSGPQLPQLVGSGLNGLITGTNAFEKAGMAIGALSAVVAVGGLVAKKPVVTKVAGAVGVIGGLGTLIWAMLRSNANNEMIADMQNDAAKNAAGAIDTYADAVRRNSEIGMVDVLIGGSVLAANAIALLLIPAR